MIYEEVVDRIDSIGQFAKDTGVIRAGKLLRDMGNPEKDLQIIHIAGTNGKGSTCAYIAQILKTNGYKTGLFTSPHLVDIRERIQINNEPVSKEEFVEAYEAVESMRTDQLAYFDYLFGMALYIFKKNRADYVVMETGLGGRFDATNAVNTPLISVITTISLEHTAILGNTIEEIAAEKAGIIKEGVPVVFCANDSRVRDVVAKRAKLCNSRCIAVDNTSYRMLQNSHGYIDFFIDNEYYKNDCFRISTSALYQIENASLALTACAVLEEYARVHLSHDLVKEAVLQTHWSGRMEKVMHNLYVDGAHNPQGIKVFVESVDSMYEGEDMPPATLLFSAVSDKNYEEMVKILCCCKHFNRVFVTVTGGVRKLSADIIENVFRENLADSSVTIQMCDDVEQALKRWDNELMFATGSLYLVGDIKNVLGNRLQEEV